MKLKRIFSIALGIVASFSLFSCGDDDAVTVQVNPAADVEGTYTGQIVKSYVDPTTSQEVVTTEDATITVTENNRYVINLTLASASLTKEGIANISKTSASYPFNNKSTDEANTFGIQFTGDFVGNGVTLTFSEESTVRVGNRPRKVNTTYTFTGVKVEEAAEDDVPSSDDEAPASDAGVE